MFTLLDDLFSSSDEEGSQKQHIQKLKQNLRFHVDIMKMPDDEFIENFRMGKDAFRYVLDEISPFLKPSCRSTAVPKITKLATCMRFLATGGYQQGTGHEILSNLSQTTVSQIINECLNIMESRLCPKWINIDVTMEEEIEIKRKFHQKFNFPGVIGCVDGTHVKIMAPNINDREHYYNRKGFYSLNVMAICDSDLVIRYVDARHPGRNHDAFVWSTSEVADYLRGAYENGKTNTWIIGDGGYQCLPYLLTPYRSPSTEFQINYNNMLAKLRNSVERCFGVLKNRFRCLIGERGLHYSPDKAKCMVNVCCALHNICIFYKHEWSPEYGSDEGDRQESTMDAVEIDADIQEFGDIYSSAETVRNYVAEHLLRNNAR